MMRKVSYIAAILVVSMLALTFAGGLAASAWSSTASYTCLGTSQITSCANQNNPSFPVGTKIYDTAIIQDPNGMVGSCNILYKSGCVTGYVVFVVYSGLSCEGTPVVKSNPLQLSGTSYPGVVSFGSTATTTGSFSIKAVYYGNYDDNTLFALPCEPLTITPTNGVPEFPFGALGYVLLLAALLPMMFVVRSKFGRSVIQANSRAKF